MSKSISLIFGCHSHQPVGNFDHVFAESYAKAYLPFLDVLQRFPHVHVTLHYTGPLFDWFKQHRPDFLQLLAKLSASGQIEIMGGGYYEPLLCAIPERDALDQIARMNSFCEEHFGKKPRGMWLAERVWEPHLPKIIKRGGLEYTALDDTHFLYSGLGHDDLFGHYITEDEGYTVKVFPILEPLRYAIPFQQVERSIAFLRENASEDGTRCAVIHDDGEKFGVWPETYHSVYEEGWLLDFFSALTENKDWLHSITYSEHLDRVPALGRTYLTCASYMEMMEWALPTAMQRQFHHFKDWASGGGQRGDEAKLFLRGGFWRSFLSKYPEANNIQKKMLRVSNKINRQAGNDDARIAEAQSLLHQGQCNCAYWHGVFGGLYLNHLRTALYEKLILAESLSDAVQHGDGPWTTIEAVDFDGDGRNEVVIERTDLCAVVSPSDGGTIVELDFRAKNFNFFNTLARREELYHDALRRGGVTMPGDDSQSHSIHELSRVKEKGLENFLIYDPYRRASLREHFLPVDLGLDDLMRCAPRELGDFATAEFSAKVEGHSAVLERTGNIAGGGRVQLVKRITAISGASGLEIQYHLRNVGPAGVRCLFASEWCVNLLSGTAYDRYYRSDSADLKFAKLGESGTDIDLHHIALRDDWGKLEFGIQFSAPARVYRFPIETVSQSEGGQERIYQGSVVLPAWKLDVAPGGEYSLTLRAVMVDTSA
jgi:alpha-amylase/alpha-mannosidase (GH57 family)